MARFSRARWSARSKTTIRRPQRRSHPQPLPPAPQPPQAPQPIELELRGPVAGLSGACPTLAFSVGAQTIVTTAATRFDNVTCETLQNGVPLKVRGAAQANGPFAATRVERDQEGPPEEVRVRGAIAGLSGACPVRSFSVNGAAVVTSAATRFDDVPCAGLQNGNAVEVRGGLQANGTILASRVKRD
jgi:hypothetical protein